MVRSSTEVEGLRFVGSRLEAPDVVDAFRPDIRAMCDRFGEDLNTVCWIEYRAQTTELVFGVELLNSEGRPYLDDDGNLAMVEHVHSANSEWRHWPKWWVPFDHGHFIDHALVDITVPTG